MAVSKRARYEVLRRDDYTCRYCGGRAPDVALAVDHVIPQSLGGDDGPANLVAACRDCNAGKAASNPDAPLVAQVADDAVRWAAAMRVAADEARADLEMDREYAEALDEEWSGWCVGGNPANTIPRPAGWESSASSFRAAGLPIDLAVDSARRALGNTRIAVDATWKYFCGIAWNRVTELQEAARRHAERPEPSAPQIRACGHCSRCLSTETAGLPDEDDEPYCNTFFEREPDEEPDLCDACGQDQCVAGHARADALIEGYIQGDAAGHASGYALGHSDGIYAAWNPWYLSFERMQFFALTSVVDGTATYGRAH